MESPRITASTQTHKYDLEHHYGGKVILYSFRIANTVVKTVHSTLYSTVQYGMGLLTKHNSKDGFAPHESQALNCVSNNEVRLRKYHRK